jgi:hypothetical protein
MMSEQLFQFHKQGKLKILAVASERRLASMPDITTGDEQGYPGSYGQVQRYLLKHRRRHRETFIPLAHPPGHRLEADFGHIHVDFPDGRRQVPVLVTVWAYSNYPFVLALPTERTEAILAGLVAAFDFFGVRPRSLVGQPRTVATAIFQGRQRQLHPRYAGGQSLRLRPALLFARAATRSPTPRGPSGGQPPFRHPGAAGHRSRRAQRPVPAALPPSKSAPCSRCPGRS